MRDGDQFVDGDFAAMARIIAALTMAVIKTKSGRDKFLLKVGLAVWGAVALVTLFTWILATQYHAPVLLVLLMQLAILWLGATMGLMSGLFFVAVGVVGMEGKGDAEQ